LERPIHLDSNGMIVSVKFNALSFVGGCIVPTGQQRGLRTWVWHLKERGQQVLLGAGVGIGSADCKAKAFAHACWDKDGSMWLFNNQDCGQLVRFIQIGVNACMGILECLRKMGCFIIKQEARTWMFILLWRWPGRVLQVD